MYKFSGIMSRRIRYLENAKITNYLLASDLKFVIH